MKKRRKKALSVSWLFWIAFILLISTLFLINKNKITSVLEKTQAKTMLFNKHKSNTDNSKQDTGLPPFQAKEDVNSIGDGSTEFDSPSNTTENTNSDQQKTQIAENTQELSTDQLSAIETRIPNKPKQDSTGNNTQTIATRQATLFLVSLDSDGSIMRRSLHKDLPKSNAPMTDALKALFAYQDSNDSQYGVLRTLIPTGTKLRSAHVKNGIAFIDVSEDFQYNQYGIDGYLAQLAQVVFTATEFPTVQSVQFLIEGQTKDYLGLEGVWIGTPLSRSSFR